FVRDAEPSLAAGISARLAASKAQRLLSHIDTTTASLVVLCSAISATDAENAEDVIDQAQESATTAIKEADVLLQKLDDLSESSIDLRPPVPTRPAERIKINLRPFDEHEPGLWFDLLEAQFRVAGFEDEHTRFAHLIRFLSDAVSYQ
ncbi:Hypothetical predicted protein, partial [Paramuricea clavata]